MHDMCTGPERLLNTKGFDFLNTDTCMIFKTRVNVLPFIIDVITSLKKLNHRHKCNWHICNLKVT